MRKAFTLLELLVVMGIMGALAAMSVSSYRALTRGMEDRSAVVAAQSFLDLAVQRAEIDHTPVVIYLYDELLQKESSDGTEERSGRGIAYAVRPSGRVTRIDNDLIMDEFSDLDQIYLSDESVNDDTGANSSNNNGGSKTKTKIYILPEGKDDKTGCKSFNADSMVVISYLQEHYVVTDKKEASSSDSTKSIRVPAFKKQDGDSPMVGDVYGTEFAVRTLPNGYFFGQSPPTSVNGHKEVTKIIVPASGSYTASVDVYRYKGGSSTTEKVGTATSTRRN